MKYIAIDIETTGLYPRKGDRIIEIAAIPIVEDRIITENFFHSYVNPEIKIPEFITKLTNIDDKTVKDSPTIEKVLPNFLRYINDLPIIAHNAEFDIGFINYFLTINHQKRLKNIIIDTLKISREVFYNEKSHSLKKVAERLKINTDNLKHHNAIDDAILAGKIFLKLRNLL